MTRQPSARRVEREGAGGWRRAALATLLVAAGCGNWHVLRPTTANNVQVGAMMLYVVSAEYGLRRDLVRVVCVIDNRTQQPQEFDPGWVQLRGGSGIAYPPSHVQPPHPGSVLPFTRTQVTYMFSHIPEQEAGQLALLVAGTPTVQFAGFY
jgi:hypothetical protein